MELLKTIDLFVYWAVLAGTAAAVILIVLRSLFKYLDVNPFTRSAVAIKRSTDPVILPVRRVLIAMRVDPVAAPVIAVVIFILVAFFVLQVTSGFLNTIAGVLFALTMGGSNASLAIVGYLIYALIGLYELMIFARIIGIWFSTSYSNRAMRFLTRTTEPLLGPVRRLVPHVGMFDISPIVAFLILWLLQALVVATLLRGWPVRFF